jgi:hypothetical protein
MKRMNANQFSMRLRLHGVAVCSAAMLCLTACIYETVDGDTSSGDSDSSGAGPGTGSGSGGGSGAGGMSGSGGGGNACDPGCGPTSTCQDGACVVCELKLLDRADFSGEAPGQPFGVSRLAVGDVNKDGAKDIVTAKGALLFAEPAGPGVGFQSGIELAFGQNENRATYDVQLFDMNKDGNLDALFVSEEALPSGSTAGRLNALLGNGDGTFSAVAEAGFFLYTAAGNAQSRIGDVDSDGVDDLVLCTRFGNGLSYWRGNGDGSFGTFGEFVNDPTAELGFASFCNHFELVDVNGDGQLDVVGTGAGASGNELVVWLGNGAGGLVKSSSMPALATEFSGEFAVGDLDGDGDRDLALPKADNAGVRVFLNQGNATFAAGEDFALPDYGHPELADIDGDGKLDLVMAGFSTGQLYVLRGQGDGGFAAFVELNSPYDYVRELEVVDLNDDGKLDLAAFSSEAGQSGSNVVSVWVNGACSQ